MKFTKKNYKCDKISQVIAKKNDKKEVFWLNYRHFKV